MWAGFATYAVSFLSGTLVASGLWGSVWSWDPQQIAAVVVLAAYGAVAVAAPMMEQPSRRAAVTVAMFAVAVGTMVTLRALPGATRHDADYGITAAEATRGMR